MSIPTVYQVKKVFFDTADVYTLTLTSKETGKGLSFLPGQFNMLYHYGFNEIPISISGDSSDKDVLVHTIRAVGPVTQSMRELKVGDEIGVRGPFGASWPLDKKGSNMLVIGGGCGLLPLRPALFHFAKNRGQYHDVTVLNGAKNPGEFLFSDDFKTWEKQGISLKQTVDVPDSSWKGHVGLITTIVKPNISDPKNTIAFVCGPEIMIRFTVKELLEAGVEKHNIFMSLEKHMECGQGFCGRCQWGPYFICKDGAVFSYPQIEKWLMIREL